MKGTILVVDDEKNQREIIADFLTDHGFSVILASDGREALDLYTRDHIDLIISDFRMKHTDGVTLLKQIKEINPTTGVILVSAYGTVETAVEAMKHGADDFLAKPVNLEQLLGFVTRALQKSALVRENDELKKRLRERFRFDGIIGESSGMQEALNIAGRAARSQATILIRGASGTGKGLLANAIHLVGDRSSGPFIEINCAALSRGVLESELFGHERGAFTGADKSRQGRFELAHGGTLFIDEIGDVPLDIQVKLLNVLQSGTYMRVGGEKIQRTNARIIAATHRNLEDMISQGLFRQDLYFRLNVVSIVIPPLHERKMDIPLLIERMIERFARENNKDIRGFSPAAMDCLLRYSYPGNVRELENVVMRAIILTRDQIIEPDDLPMNMRLCGPENGPGTGIDDVEIGPLKLPLMVEQLERKVIIKALKTTSGVQTKAATILGITERNLRYKMMKYKITIDSVITKSDF